MKLRIQAEVKKAMPYRPGQVPVDVKAMTMQEAVHYACHTIVMGGGYHSGAPGLSSVRRFLQQMGREDFTGLKEAWRKETGLV